MLTCDFIAEISTVIIFILLKTNNLHVWHLYLLNAINSFMNTFQQPASEVATTLLMPEKYYQKISGLCSFSQSLNSILRPIIATAIFSFSGIELIILVDFIIAFMTLLFFLKIPESPEKNIHQESLFLSVRSDGFLLGGLLIDNIFEPFIENQSNASFWVLLFGAEKGSGTALLFFAIGIIDILICLLFSKQLKKYQ